MLYNRYDDKVSPVLRVEKLPAELGLAVGTRVVLGGNIFCVDINFVKCLWIFAWVDSVLCEFLGFSWTAENLLLLLNRQTLGVPQSNK